MTIIDCISDLHGHYPKLEGGDLLIIAGDLTAQDTKEQNYSFWKWAANQSYHEVVVIAGNHDNFLKNNPFALQVPEENLCYLSDSGTEFRGLKIWGSPWTKTFEGMNQDCKAFTVDTDEELEEKWKYIPEKVDILVTHSPPHGILDKAQHYLSVGSKSLANKVEVIKPRAHIFGHIHESYGQLRVPFFDENKELSSTIYVNACHVDEYYRAVNKPIRIIL